MADIINFNDWNKKEPTPHTGVCICELCYKTVQFEETKGGKKVTQPITQTTEAKARACFKALEVLAKNGFIEQGVCRFTWTEKPLTIAVSYDLFAIYPEEDYRSKFITIINEKKPYTIKLDKGRLCQVAVTLEPGFPLALT